MNDDLPKSRNVGRCEARDYWITAGSWDTGYGESYEIGIRQKEGLREFWLLQGRWNERSVMKAAGAVVMMLNDGYTPTEIIREVFGDAN